MRLVGDQRAEYPSKAQAVVVVAWQEGVVP